MFRYPASDDLTRAGYVIAGDRFAILVAADIPDGLLARLWDAAAAETSVLEDVLSVVVAVGVDALPDFAVAEFSGTTPETLRVAARGSATITTSSGDVVTGRDVRTWTETTLAGADGIRLSLDGTRPSADVLPLGLGVIRADEVSWGRPVHSAANGARPRLRAAARRAAATGGEPLAAAPGEPLAAEPAEPSAPVAPPRAAALDESDVLETLSIDRSLFARPLDEDVELPAFLADDAPAAEAGDADDAAPDDRTLLGSRRAKPAPVPAGAYVLRLASGRDLPLDRPVVLGRGPRPARHPGARIETVPSPAKEISGSHLLVELDGDQIVARDLDSTNGTIVRPRDGEPRLLRGGATLRVPVGTVFDLGDGVTAVFQAAP